MECLTPCSLDDGRRTDCIQLSDDARCCGGHELLAIRQLKS